MMDSYEAIAEHDAELDMPSDEFYHVHTMSASLPPPPPPSIQTR